MQHVVERVLGTEEEARARLERARKQAGAIRGSAEESAAALLAQARADALAANKKRLEDARTAAAELLAGAHILEEAKAATASAAAHERTDTIVADIVAMITGQTDFGP